MFIDNPTFGVFASHCYSSFGNDQQRNTGMAYLYNQWTIPTIPEPHMESWESGFNAGKHGNFKISFPSVYYIRWGIWTLNVFKTIIPKLFSAHERNAMYAKLSL